VWLVEIAESMREENLLLISDVRSGAANVFSVWLVAGVPRLLGFSVACLCFCAPVGLLSGLRPQVSHYALFYAALYMSVVVNLHILQLAAALAPNLVTTIVFFPAASIAFQVHTNTHTHSLSEVFFSH
jgi:hypothetical protein